MWVFLGDLIDENRFHNCVRESEQALLVLVSTEGSQCRCRKWRGDICWGINSRQRFYSFIDKCNLSLRLWDFSNIASLYFIIITLTKSFGCLFCFVEACFLGCKMALSAVSVKDLALFWRKDWQKKQTSISPKHSKWKKWVHPSKTLRYLSLLTKKPGIYHTFYWIWLILWSIL